MFAPGILWFLLNRLRDPGLGYLGWMDGVHQVMWWWTKEVNLTGWRFDGVVSILWNDRKIRSFWVFFLQKSRRWILLKQQFPNRFFLMICQTWGAIKAHIILTTFVGWWSCNDHCEVSPDEPQNLVVFPTWWPVWETILPLFRPEIPDVFQRVSRFFWWFSYWFLVLILPPHPGIAVPVYKHASNMLVGYYCWWFRNPKPPTVWMHKNL